MMPFKCNYCEKDVASGEEDVVFCTCGNLLHPLPNPCGPVQEWIGNWDEMPLERVEQP
jgi:hypothetical protein